MNLLSEMRNLLLIYLWDIKLEVGELNSSINPFISSKIIPGIGNTIHFGGTYDYKGVFEVGGGYKKHQVYECDGHYKNQVRIIPGLCL